MYSLTQLQDLSSVFHLHFIYHFLILPYFHFSAEWSNRIPALGLCPKFHNPSIHPSSLAFFCILIYYISRIHSICIYNNSFIPSVFLSISLSHFFVIIPSPVTNRGSLIVKGDWRGIKPLRVWTPKVFFLDDGYLPYGKEPRYMMMMIFHSIDIQYTNR